MPPEPDVTVTSRRDEPAGVERVDVTIKRESQERSYSGAGATRDEATRQVIRDIVKDPYTAEWLPPARKGDAG